MTFKTKMMELNGIDIKNVKTIDRGKLRQSKQSVKS